jgi:hypothetical protein
MSYYRGNGGGNSGYGPPRGGKWRNAVRGGCQQKCLYSRSRLYLFEKADKQDITEIIKDVMVVTARVVSHCARNSSDQCTREEKITHFTLKEVITTRQAEEEAGEETGARDPVVS